MSIEPVLTVLAALVALWAVWKFVKWAMKVLLTLVIVGAAFGYLYHQGYLDQAATQVHDAGTHATHHRR